MGVTKTEEFTSVQNGLADVFKVLGHPARISIIQHLVSIDSCVCGDLVDVLPLSQATVSQHLRELKRMDIIQGRVAGTSVCYCINPDRWQEVKEQVTAFLDHYPNAENCC